MRVEVEKAATSPCHDHDWVMDLRVIRLPGRTRRICRRCGRVERLSEEPGKQSDAFQVLYERFHGEKEA